MNFGQPCYEWTPRLSGARNQSTTAKKILVSEPLQDQETRRNLATPCNRLILILDESGSMSSQKSDIIGGINEMIHQQRQVEPKRNDEIHFDIVKFNDYVQPMREETLNSIREFTPSDYTPSGTTALFDAIGMTIRKFKHERNVVMVIATDGQENASQKYTYKQISQMISDQRKNMGWNMVYLSEDIDTFQQGDIIGISNGQTGCYNQMVGKGFLGQAMQTKSCNSNIRNLRMGYDADFSSVSSASSASSVPPRKPKHVSSVTHSHSSTWNLF